MARHNFILLVGLVAQPPKVIKNDETGEYIQAICPVTVISGQRKAGNEDYSKYKLDNPVLVTGDANLCKAISEWKPGDIVEVKGVLVTKNVNKKVTCSQCGKVHVNQGSSVFVRPIYTAIKNRNIGTKDVIPELRKNIEVSNVAIVLGTVCKQPEIYVSDKGLHVAQYPIAINRKYRIKEDSMDIKTDYPYVKAYGKQADDDYKYLSVNDDILIDGCLQTREYEKKLECECGAQTAYFDSSLEIIPYQTEYFLRTQSRVEDEQENTETVSGESIADQILKN